MSEKLSREQVREALADETDLRLASDDLYGSTDALDKLDVVIAAARAYVDQGDALVIRKVNGEWPEWIGDLLLYWKLDGGPWQSVLDALAPYDPALSDRSDTQ